MNFSDIPIPEVYKESADFRFFLEWFGLCLSKIQNQTENIIDLLDPERCPASLLWLLCDTEGYKYDDRMPISYNRLVLLHFMSLIRNKGSKIGVTLGAELNLAQFNILDYAQEDEAYEDRVADTSIPVNSVYVTSHTDEGYIDIVYYSEEVPKDTCLEYVRPLGMYCFTHAGVRADSRTKISIDARLTDKDNVNLKIGPTRVGHYRRADYASMQVGNRPRNPVYYRNSDYEKEPTPAINPGYRSLYSLQLCNNEHIVKSLIPSQKDPDYSIFSLGYGPQNVEVRYPDNYLKTKDDPMYNLRYDLEAERELGTDVYTIDEDRTESIIKPRPAITPVMASMGDSISMSDDNSKFTKVTDSGVIVEDVTDQ